MTKELSIRCDASTVQGTSEANHDTYGYFFDSPNRRTLLWVIDGATPFEKEKYPNALYHIVRQLSKTLEHTFGRYAECFERVGLQRALTEAIAKMRNIVAVLAPTHGIRPRPSLMEGDNYDAPDANDAFWTEFGTFSITNWTTNTPSSPSAYNLGIVVCWWTMRITRTDAYTSSVRLSTARKTTRTVIRLFVRKQTNQTGTISVTCLDEVYLMPSCGRTSL